MNHVLIVSENRLVRVGLRALVRATRPDLTVVEDETFSKAKTNLSADGNFVLVIIDIKTRDLGGFFGLSQLRGEYPDIPVVVYSTSADVEFEREAAASGVASFFSNSTPSDVIEHILTKSLSKDETLVPNVANEQQINPAPALSPAELNVLRGLRRGLRNKQIAFELGITERTVKWYAGMVYRKLGVNSRTQAILLMQEMTLESSYLYCRRPAVKQR